MAWGDKGEEFRPDKCEHEPDDGCEWCCEQCNHDSHWCPGCGTVSNHKQGPCGDCVKTYELEPPNTKEQKFDNENQV